MVTLPNGRRLFGNRIFRGEAAAGIAEQLIARVAARGLDTSSIDASHTPPGTLEPPVDGFIHPPQSQVGEQIRVSVGVPSIGTNPRVSGAGYNP